MGDIFARLGVDVLSAGASAAVISPVIFIVDKSIMEATSGKQDSIRSSVRNSVSSLVHRPLAFLGSVPFLILYSVYSATYCAANFVDTAATSSLGDAASWKKQTAGYPKFVATTSINLSASVYKDMRYAKFFGIGPPRRITPSSMLLFGSRDSLTVFASFNVPQLLAPYIGLNVAQVVTPCAMQFLSTPLHLLGLDIYNRPDQTSSSRLRKVAEGYWRSSFARICRILPAFGVGGVLNREIRGRGMSALHASLHS